MTTGVYDPQLRRVRMLHAETVCGGCGAPLAANAARLRMTDSDGSVSYACEVNCMRRDESTIEEQNHAD